MQKIIKGNQIQLFYQDKTLAYATAHTLTLTGENSSINSKDHAEWNASSVSNLSWEVTGDYFYTDLDYDTLFDLMLYKRPILVQVAEVGNYSENGLVDLGGDVTQWVPAAKGKQGYAVITSLNLNANSGEYSSYSLTLTGSGPLVKVDNTITPYYVDVKYEDGVLQTGFQLFDVSHHPYVNSVWVYPTGAEGSKTEIQVANGKLVSEDDIKDITSPVIRVYLPNPNVTEYLFYSISGIYGAYLPDSITTIEEYAFAGSSINTVVTESESIDYKPYCFANCNFLEAVNKTTGTSGLNYLSARQIGANAFTECVRLGNINVGSGCKTIGMESFYDCMAMNDVYLGNALVAVGDLAFERQMDGVVNFHFYTEKAPTIPEDGRPFGKIRNQTFNLYNTDSASSWRSGVVGWGPDSYYNDAEYIIKI